MLYLVDIVFSARKIFTCDVFMCFHFLYDLISKDWCTFSAWFHLISVTSIREGLEGKWWLFCFKWMSTATKFIDAWWELCFENVRWSLFSFERNTTSEVYYKLWFIENGTSVKQYIWWRLYMVKPWQVWISLLPLSCYKYAFYLWAKEEMEAYWGRWNVIDAFVFNNPLLQKDTAFHLPYHIYNDQKLKTFRVKIFEKVILFGTENSERIHLN